MRVLLLHLNMTDQSKAGFARFMAELHPVGLSYIAATLEREGFPVAITGDFEGLTITPQMLLDRAKEFNADVLGVSVLTANAPRALGLAAYLKKHLPGLRVVFGNSHASYFAREMVTGGAVDAVVHDEGEITMLDLVRAWERGAPLSSVRGITYTEDGQPRNTPRRDFLPDLDDLPFPAWHLLPVKHHTAPSHLARRLPALPIVGTRGCPFQCTFCSFKTVGENVRARSPANIADEVERDIEQFGARHLVFCDALFPHVKQKHCLDVCDEFIARGLNRKVEWTAETRVDAVNGEVLRKMREAGCARIYYGVESGSDKTLKEVKKAITTDETRRAMAWSHKHGIQTGALCILGFPGETHESAIRTADFVRELDADFAIFKVLVPYPGTPMYDLFSAEGRVRHRRWEYYVGWYQNPEDLPYVPDGMTAEELLQLHNRAMYMFYRRPRIILRHLFKIRTFRASELIQGACILVYDRARLLLRGRDGKAASGRRDAVDRNVPLVLDEPGHAAPLIHGSLLQEARHLNELPRR